jgi:hypothetical protein
MVQGSRRKRSIHQPSPHLNSRDRTLHLHHVYREFSEAIRPGVLNWRELAESFIEQSIPCPERQGDRSLQAFRYPLGARVISLLKAPCSIFQFAIAFNNFDSNASPAPEERLSNDLPGLVTTNQISPTHLDAGEDSRLDTRRAELAGTGKGKYDGIRPRWQDAKLPHT